MQWVAAGLKNRPELQVRQFELAALGEESALTRFSPFDSTEVGIEGERADSAWAAGPALAIPIPLFDFGQAKRQKARAAVIEARHALTQSQRQIVEEIRRAYASLAASRENLKRVRDELIPLEQERLEQAEAQYRAGQADISSLLLAEQDLRAARSREVDLQRRTAEALFRLQRAVGGPAISPEASDVDMQAPDTDLGSDAQGA